MADPKPTTTTTPGQRIVTGSSGSGSTSSGSGSTEFGSIPTSNQIYVGVESGSDLEKFGYQSTAAATHPFGVPLGPTHVIHKKPNYKVGYLNSQNFARELGNNNPDTIYLYQQRMRAAGILEDGSYTPGSLDKATRAGFKELVTRANQTATSWQSALQDAELVGGKAPKVDPTRQPLTVGLTDPEEIRSTVRQVAGKLYGGVLPDTTTEAIVTAVRDSEAAAQTADYNAGLEKGVTFNKPRSVESVTEETVRKQHPNEVAATQFSNMFDSIVGSLTSNQSGYNLRP